MEDYTSTLPPGSSSVECLLFVLAKIVDEDGEHDEVGEKKKNNRKVEI